MIYFWILFSNFLEVGGEKLLISYLVCIVYGVLECLDVYSLWYYFMWYLV